MLTSLLLLLAAEAVAPAVPANLTEPDPAHMTPRDIKAFNAQVPRTHKWYIRCTATPEIGSLAKMVRICRTNAEWQRVETEGNDNARDTADRMSSKAMVTE